MKTITRCLFLIFLLQTTVQADADFHRKQGEAFLAEKAQDPDVVTLESGLLYKVIVEGTGRRPAASDRVAVYYQGYLVSGEPFDGTDIIRPPVVFQVDRLIPGWTEALQLMREGAIWELYVPAHLAYGERGSGRRIPPHAALFFEIELVEIAP